MTCPSLNQWAYQGRGIEWRGWYSHKRASRDPSHQGAASAFSQHIDMLWKQPEKAAAYKQIICGESDPIIIIICLIPWAKMWKKWVIVRDFRWNHDETFPYYWNYWDHLMQGVSGHWAAWEGISKLRYRWQTVGVVEMLVSSGSQGKPGPILSPHSPSKMLTRPLSPPSRAICAPTVK